MKKISLYIVVVNCLLITVNSFAQVPQAIPYQAVARDTIGNLIINHNISLRFSVHDVTAIGTVVYKETQNTTTNALGLFTVNIGQGTVVTGTFVSINWGSNAKFLQVEMDTAGGSNYANMGTQQMLSVPYALYAATSTSSASDWKLTGNSGSTDSNFVGTISNIPLNFKINNQKAGRIDHTNRITTLGFLAGNSLTTGVDNVLIGDSSGFAINSLNDNTIVGTNAGVHHASSNSSFFGESAGYSNTTGYYNSFFGSRAGKDNVTGSANAFFGTFTGQENVSGSANSYFGIEAGRGCDTCRSNSYFGYRAGWFNQGNENCFFGVQSGYGSFSTGIQNAFFGYVSGYNNSSGTENAFFGRTSGYNNLNGSSNTFIGKSAGFSNTSGSSNSFVGRRSASQNSTGNNNVAIGDSTSYNNSSGSQNVSIGSLAGDANLNGSNITIIGYAADVTVAGNINNATAIGAFARVDTSNAIVLGSISGINGATNSVNVGIGTTTPSSKLNIEGNGTSAELFRISNDKNSTKDSVMVFTNSGRVGIGTTTPSFKLEVRTTTTGQPATYIRNDATTGTNYGIDAEAQGTGATTNIAGWFQANNATNNYAIIVPSNSGNVGIGLSNPTATLDVAGTAKIGTNGTILTNIIKSSPATASLAIAANTTSTQTYAVANAVTGSSVLVSPASAINAGLVIAYARVSSGNTVEVSYRNTTAASITLTAGITLYITVIQ